jgi:LTXXQ motif family protein
MRKLPSAVTGVAAGIALALAGAAYAQPCTGAGPGSGPGMGMGHGPGPMAGCADGPGAGMGPGYGPMHGRGHGSGMGPGYGRMGGGDPVVAAESRLDTMKAELKITAAQEASWQAFAATAKEQAASMKALRSDAPSAAGTAPERMAEHAKHMQVRANGMAKMASAFNTLYLGLTAEQKAIADQYHGMGGPRARGWGPRAG